MLPFISLLIIGISLSMDTFSLSLSIGTFIKTKKETIIMSFLVGIMHFFMPLIGIFLGNKILLFLKLNVNHLLGIILLFICMEMIIDLFKKDEKLFELNLLNIMLISFSVSLDSFSTGIGLNAVTNNYLLAGITFSVCATAFTYLGLLIGKYSNDRLGMYANLIGIIILLLVGITHFFK